MATGDGWRLVPRTYRPRWYVRLSPMRKMACKVGLVCVCWLVIDTLVFFAISRHICDADERARPDPDATADGACWTLACVRARARPHQSLVARHSSLVTRRLSLVARRSSLDHLKERRRSTARANTDPLRAAPSAAAPPFRRKLLALVRRAGRLRRRLVRRLPARRDRILHDAPLPRRRRLRPLRARGPRRCIVASPSSLVLVRNLAIDSRSAALYRSRAIDAFSFLTSPSLSVHR